MYHDDFYFTRAKELSAEGYKIHEIQKIINKQLEDFPDKEKVMRTVLLKDQPAELLRLKAIDSIYDDNDYTWALHLINEALELNDVDVEPNLLALKEEVTLKIENRKKIVNNR